MFTAKKKYVYCTGGVNVIMCLKFKINFDSLSEHFFNLKYTKSTMIENWTMNLKYTTHLKPLIISLNNC
jgi:hypothetical protein